MEGSHVNAQTKLHYINIVGNGISGWQSSVLEVPRRSATRVQTQPPSDFVHSNCEINVAGLKSPPATLTPTHRDNALCFTSPKNSHLQLESNSSDGEDGHTGVNNEAQATIRSHWALKRPTSFIYGGIVVSNFKARRGEVQEGSQDSERNTQSCAMERVQRGGSHPTRRTFQLPDDQWANELHDVCLSA